MHRALVQMIRMSDVRVFYIISALFVIPIYMIVGSAYGIAYNFYRHHMAMGALRSFFMVWRNFYSFSKAVIDKFAMAAGNQFDIFVEGYDTFHSVYDKEAGFIQLSSHVGNFEIAGFTINSSKKPINITVFAGEKESVMEERKRLFTKTNMKMIPVGEGIDHIFMMNEALSKGEVVTIPCDRILGSEKYVETEFLGGIVRLPKGPFHLATARGVDVITMHVMKVAAKSYRVHIEKLDYNRDADRKAQIDELAGAYVRELEHMVRMYPEQWYNFFEFWRA